MEPEALAKTLVQWKLEHVTVQANSPASLIAFAHNRIAANKVMKAGFMIQSACLSLLLVQYCAICGEVFDLKLDERRPQVGVETEGKYTVHMKITDVFELESVRREKNQEFSFELLARRQVTGLRGRSETIELRIERLLEIDGTNTEVLLPKGALVIGKCIAGKKIFTSPDSGLPTKASLALSALVPLEDENPSLCDDAALFAAQGVREIGQTWEPNKPCLSQAMERTEIGVRPDRIEATATLADIEDLNGLKCFRLTITGNLHSLELPRAMRDEPRLRTSELTAETTMKLQSSALFPTDTALAQMGQDDSAEGVSNIRFIRGGKTGTMTVKANRESHWEHKILK